MKTKDIGMLNPCYINHLTDMHIRGEQMRRVIQEDSNGCGIACIAMLSGRKYSDVKKLATSILKDFKGNKFRTTKSDLVSIGKDFGLKFGKATKPKEFELLPDRAILAINYKEESKTHYAKWHWVVFCRDNNEQYVLDPREGIKTDKRKDLKQIYKHTHNWFRVESVYDIG